MRLVFAVFGMCLAVGLGSAMAQTDYHLDADPARSLYQQSVWAHGYIHGYETGFHYGNFDLQISGGARGEKQLKNCRNPKHHYKKEFGGRSSFDSGFKEGFKMGYADGVTGEVFRAAELTRSIVSSGDKVQQPVDEGIASGYLQGRTQGLSDGRLDAAFAPGKALCPREAGTQSGYCGSYALGFRWGYSDGYHNQRSDLPTRSALRRP